MSIHVLIINPNSSEIVTAGLERALAPCIPPGTIPTYFTAPPDAPPSIDDEATSAQSCSACMRVLGDSAYARFDAFLVCCFSDHPLARALRETHGKPAVHIFRAAVERGVELGVGPVGIITTGAGWIEPLTRGALEVLGERRGRFVGVEATGLGVVELKSEGGGEGAGERVGAAAVAIARRGARVVILGCAGMAGMEGVVGAAVRGAGMPVVEVVDGAKAGVQILVGLVRRVR